MFDLFRRSQSNLPSPSLARALEADGLPPSVSSAQLAVVSEKGQYAGRGVNYFRVFDPRQTDEQGLKVRAYRDFDQRPELVLRSGHVERNGQVVVTRGDDRPQPAPTARREADLTGHDDDQRIIFGGQRS